MTRTTGLLRFARNDARGVIGKGAFMKVIVKEVKMDEEINVMGAGEIQPDPEEIVG
jgi:hypothetical protein